ncbi:MAG: FAD-binding oxidoreductase [Chloroflexi bacterium]|nr:FAD-binding oxidoreductase [Chloroflexota bacterium]
MNDLLSLLSPEEIAIESELPDLEIDGRTPTMACRPATVDGVAAVLRAATAAQLAVASLGGGTQRSWGGRLDRLDLVLALGRLDRIVECEPADLTITVEAGVPLGRLQTELARHRQFLPLDPPLPPTATIGGVVATGASGSLRFGYGTARDFVLGARFVLADGTVARTGGRVVKNVAGYDLAKLLIGSFGTLGVVVELSLKVSPLPADWQTLVAAVPDADTAQRAAAAVMRRGLPFRALDVLDIGALGAGPTSVLPLSAAEGTGRPALTPGPSPASRRGAGGEGPGTRADSSFVSPLPPAGEGPGVRAARYAVAARAGGTPAMLARLEREFTAAATEAGAMAVERLGDAAADALWQSVQQPAPPDAVVTRAGALPSQLGGVLAAVEHVGTSLGRTGASRGQCGSGVVRTVWRDAGEGEAGLAALVGALRARLTALGGWLVVESCPPALKEGLDVWGPLGDQLRLMQAIKAQFDPAGILNPGRYPFRPR